MLGFPGGGTFLRGREQAGSPNVGSKFSRRRLRQDKGIGMTISQKIAPHIPYLRRYARALTGNQKSGDAYVAAVIESLLTDPSAFEKELNPRVALYKVFTKIWRSLSVNRQKSEERPFDHDLDSQLDVITLPARHAFLLLSIEDFSNAQAAAILEVS